MVFHHGIDVVQNVLIIVYPNPNCFPRSLKIETTENQASVYGRPDVKPILVLDMWEHAYYLDAFQYKAAYVDNWFKLVSWQRVEHMYEHTRENKAHSEL